MNIDKIVKGVCIGFIAIGAILAIIGIKVTFFDASVQKEAASDGPDIVIGSDLDESYDSSGSEADYAAAEIEAAAAEDSVNEANDEESSETKEGKDKKDKDKGEKESNELTDGEDDKDE